MDGRIVRKSGKSSKRVKPEKSLSISRSLHRTGKWCEKVREESATAERFSLRLNAFKEVPAETTIVSSVYIAITIGV